MQISGAVRLELHLSPSGGVQEIKVVGGNPVLISAAEDAVRKTHFQSPGSCMIIYQFK